jgi:hypothetical protein
MRSTLHNSRLLRRFSPGVKPGAMFCELFDPILAHIPTDMTTTPTSQD